MLFWPIMSRMCCFIETEQGFAAVNRILEEMMRFTIQNSLEISKTVLRWHFPAIKICIDVVGLLCKRTVGSIIAGRILDIQIISQC